MTAATMAPPRRPPHDPLSLILNAATGWPLPDDVGPAGGSAMLGPLDSQLQDCVWHRVVLHGEVPKGCSIAVRSFTAHAELDAPPEQTDPRWQVGQTVTGPAREWDCLIRSSPGRYCWLRLDMIGTDAVGPCLSAVEVEYPRVSLRRYLPSVYSADVDAADFTDRFLALFDRQLRSVEQRIDDLPALLDPEATNWLDWLSNWVGLVLDSRLPEAIRRRLLANSSELFDSRGTRHGLHWLLVLLLGLDRPPHAGLGCRWAPPPLILEHFRLCRWLRNGASRIGNDAMLWGASIANRSQLDRGAQVGSTQLKTSQDPLRDPFHVYAHRYTVFLPASAGATAQQRRVIDGLLRFATPAHAAGTVRYVAPMFRIGIQSSLGLDSVIARIPAGLRLGDTPLGSSVLTGTDPRPGTPRRLGINSVLR